MPYVASICAEALWKTPRQVHPALRIEREHLKEVRNIELAPFVTDNEGAQIAAGIGEVSSFSLTSDVLPKAAARGHIALRG